MRLSSIVSVTALALAIALPASVQASTSNPPDLYLGRQGAVSCNLCHNRAGGAATGSLTLQGLPKVFEPGKAYTLTVKVAQAGVKSAGFRLDAQTVDHKQGGKIVNRDPSLDVHVAENGITYLKQSYNGTSTNGSERSWSFVWKAPESGSVHFSIDAVAGDGDGTVVNDQTYTYSADVQAGTAASGQAD